MLQKSYKLWCTKYTQCIQHDHYLLIKKFEKNKHKIAKNTIKICQIND